MIGQNKKILTKLSNKFLKVGIVGCGNMGLLTNSQYKATLPEIYIPLSHADAVSFHPMLELAGFCDKSIDALDKAKNLYPGVPVYQDPLELLNKTSPDLICIATRTPERFKLIELFLSKGVKLFHVEKPLCNSFSQLQRISELIEEKNPHFTFGAIRRYLGPYQGSIKLLNDGLIGKLQEVSFSLGSTLLCWNHIHGIDLIQSILKPYKIKYVRALSRKIKPQDPLDFVLDDDPEISFIQFETFEGPQGLISRSGGCDLKIYGDKGIIEVLNDGLESFYRKCPNNSNQIYWTERNKIILPDSSYKGTAAALDRLTKNDENLSRIDNEAMLYSQRLLFACVQSILNNGAPVDPDEINKDIAITGRFRNLYA